jgi:DNA polymerase III subunit gamma/tau
MTEELYKKYRPKNFNEVVGNADSVRTIRGFLKTGKVPHTILFTGGSGCGKTTLARIMRDKLECGPNFHEIDAATNNGIDMVRDIRQRINLAPINGKCRIWLIDEAHELTSKAQNAFLKILEDTPRHVYFMLATTDPAKLLPTIKTRATEIKCATLTHTQVCDLVNDICKKEKRELTEEVVERIATAAEGSARLALNILHSVLQSEDEDQQLKAITALSQKENAFEIARLLVKQGTKWPEMAKLIKQVAPTDSDAEGIRRMILSYANTLVLGSGKLTDRGYILLDTFRDNWYDCGKAGLTACCYDIIVGSK